MKVCSRILLGVIAAIALQLSAVRPALASETCTVKTARQSNASTQVLCECETVTRSMLRYIQRRTDFESVLKRTSAECPLFAALLTDIPTATIGSQQQRSGDGPADERTTPGPFGGSGSGGNGNDSSDNGRGGSDDGDNNDNGGNDNDDGNTGGGDDGDDNDNTGGNDNDDGNDNTGGGDDGDDNDNTGGGDDGDDNDNGGGDDDGEESGCTCGAPPGVANDNQPDKKADKGQRKSSAVNVEKGKGKKSGKKGKKGKGGKKGKKGKKN